MNVPREINAAAVESLAERPSAEKHTPMDPQGVKPGKSSVTPMMHGCVLLRATAKTIESYAKSCAGWVRQSEGYASTHPRSKHHPAEDFTDDLSAF